MNKKIILSSILIIIFIISLVVTNKFNLKKEQTDSERFKLEYEQYNNKVIEGTDKKYLSVSIDEKNPIIYSEYKDIKKIITSGTGIIYFGFPQCPWCRNAIPVLLEATNELSIDKIYYFNALSIRDKKHLDEEGNIIVDEEGTKEYAELVKLLYNYLPVYDGLNDESIKRLYFPTVLFVKDGKIIGQHTSTVDSQTDPSKGLTKKQKQELKDIYIDYINKTYDILCDQSC